MVCALEMGIGTVTVRVLFDELRAEDDGWPRADDLQKVNDYLDTVRPVAVKDFWVVAPIKQFIDVRIANLVPDNSETRAAIRAKRCKKCCSILPSPARRSLRYGKRKR